MCRDTPEVLTLMATNDPDLNESEVDEPFDFPPLERRIVTQPYDLSLKTLQDQWEHGELIVPEIQREYV